MMVKTIGRRAEDKKADKAGKYCDNCNQNGHTRESCFKIIGLPDWFKELKEQKKKAGNAANMVADTPIDFVNDKENIDLVGVLSVLQELAKVVKNKADEQDQRTRKILIEGKVAGNLYVLRQTNVVEKIGNYISNTSFSTCNHANRSITTDVTLWHHRLGHAAIDSIKHVDGINMRNIDCLPDVCEICHYAKQHSTADASRISHIGEVVEAKQPKELGEDNTLEFETIRVENSTSDLGGSENRDEESISANDSDCQQGEKDVIEEGSQELELQDDPPTLIQEQATNNNFEQGFSFQDR
ncbi:putative ribonuclease H-like domain-containing protein [Senna tora]|uniref:Putative ribonuclease H-like domain-containing protein n=1 Tax=Senna tora TaxID=362788 RepID=A0A834XDF2_9FABA|nr:putative ribonuclease H-like domain-containing protein [Senna tora]